MEIALDLGRTGNRDSIERTLQLIEKIDNLEIIPLGSLTTRIEAGLGLDLKLTVHDAYHAATALENRTEVFVTRDKVLASRLKRLVKVSQPEDIRADEALRDPR